MKLKNGLFCLALVGTTALVTATVVSQDHPEHPKAGDKPEWMTPEIMEKLTPGENHRELDKFVGKWTSQCKVWEQAGTTPEESSGTAEYSWILDGRYLKGKHTGDMGGHAFEGIEIKGYDNNREEFTSIWLDSMSTAFMVSKGELNNGKFELKGAADCCFTGEKDKAYRLVTSFPTKDQMKFEMYTAGPDGREFKTMEIVSTRTK